MAREETKSKLIRLLQHISRGSVARIGLVPVKETLVPAMALVVGFTGDNTQGIAQAVAAGADAIAIPPAQALAAWEELTRAAGDKPLGLLIARDSALNGDTLKECLNCGPDFVIAAAGGAPAALLNAKVGKIVSLDESYPAQLVRTLGEMPVDAVLAEASTDGAGVLSIRDLLHYRQVVDLIHRPVLVTASERMTSDVLPALRDMGVEGWLVQLPATAKPEEIRSTVAASREDIDGLGKSIGRAREFGRATAMLPRIHPPGQPGAPGEPEEEPDDE